MLAASTDNYTLYFNGKARPHQQGRQDRVQIKAALLNTLLPSMALYGRPSIRERHLPACSCLWLVCATAQGSGRCLQQARHVTKAGISPRTACMLTAQTAIETNLPFFPGFSSPSFSYHSLQLTKPEGCSPSSWCLNLPALQTQVQPCCSRHDDHAITSYLMSTPHLLLNDEMEALRLQGAT